MVAAAVAVAEQLVAVIGSGENHSQDFGNFFGR